MALLQVQQWLLCVVLHHKEQLKVYLVTLSSNVASLSLYNRVQHPLKMDPKCVLVGEEKDVNAPLL